MKKNFIILITFCVCFNQEIITEFLVVEHDTIDVFSYQIPDGYNDETSRPLLIVFHQWGGDENSTYYTTFDEEANTRGWFFMSPFGGSNNNYNHQGAQEMVKNEIIWMADNYNIDTRRIYMVGGSMGGAAGMIYSNNHLDPTEPMVAATASGSGILDCERRAIEMDGNNSMTEWFGGNWDEVPFQYHRNSAIYFNDFTQSMHFNLKYLPIYLDFGISEPHRIHAEEMYEILLEYNDNMWIDAEPTGSHGFSVMDEEHTCDWLSQFELIDGPNFVHVNLDEPSRAYYLEALNQTDSLEFININSEKISNTLNIHNFSNSDTLVLHILENNSEYFYLNLDVEINRLGITGSALYNFNGGSTIANFEGIGIDTEIPLFAHVTDNILWLEYSVGDFEYPLPSGSYEINIQVNFLDGDVNQDGSQNVQDIILMINYIIGTNDLYESQIQIADLNNDGGVDVMDIILLVNIIINP